MVDVAESHSLLERTGNLSSPIHIPAVGWSFKCDWSDSMMRLEPLCLLTLSTVLSPNDSRHPPVQGLQLLISHPVHSSDPKPKPPQQNVALTAFHNNPKVGRCHLSIKGLVYQSHVHLLANHENILKSNVSIRLGRNISDSIRSTVFFFVYFNGPFHTDQFFC